MADKRVSADGEVVARLRTERGWTQETLAKKAGYDVRTIQNLEAGKPIQLGTLAAVAEALGVVESTLLARSDEAAEPSPPEKGGIAISVRTEKIDINLRIDAQWDDYGIEKRVALRNFLTAFLELDDAPELEFQPGSVLVTVRDLTLEQALKLKDGLYTQEFEALNIVSVVFVGDDPANTLAVLGRSLWMPQRRLSFDSDTLSEQKHAAETPIGVSESHRTVILGYSPHEPQNFHEPKKELQAGEVRRGGPDLTRLRVARFSELGKEDPEVDYTVRAVVGEGGMGVVLLARDHKFAREVAIKKVRTTMSENESDRGKLVTEAIITAQLEHPNIVPVHELGLSPDGQPFYAMKFVEGSEWERKIKRLDEEENLEILLKVSEAIAFAHSKNVINRDIKPGNVMLGKFGEVLVMDWGLAARLDCDTEIPPAGTPIYMAPETALEYLDRAQGIDVPSSRTKRYKAGKYSDIYLLGGLLFKAVTGKAAHTGKNTLDCLKNAAKNRIVQVDKKSELLEIAYKAMATDPEDRYKSATEFIDAIKSYQRHAQSLLITRRATDDLEHAEQKLTEGGATAATATYALFSRAQHGYQNALDLWPDNRRAKRQVVKAQRRYAEVAYGAGDLDLALTLLDPNSEEDAPLRSEAEGTIRRRKTRETWFTRLQYATAASLVLALVGAGVILVKNNAIQNLQVKAADLENRAGEATKLANTKTTEAEAATELAKAKTREAEEAEKLAKIKTHEAEEAAKLAAARTRDAALAEQLAQQKTAEAMKATKLAQELTKRLKILETGAREATERTKSAEEELKRLRREIQQNKNTESTSE